jgi:SOS response regulatory protein OraA/RecX
VDNSRVNGNEKEGENGSKAVQKRLRQKGVADQVIIKAVQLLSRHCVYYKVTQEQEAKAQKTAEPYKYNSYVFASAARC